MKKNSLLLIFIIVSISCIAQIRFENGYFIKEKNDTTYCLIKNIDWENNPTEIDYKLSENETTQTLKLSGVKEFGIFNFSKYRCFSVNIDKSSESLNELSVKNEPEFVNEFLCLKVIIEGKATLYYYKSANMRRYFFSKDNAAPEQLIYKTYFLEKTENGFTNKVVAQNNLYRSQLYSILDCNNFTLDKIEKVNYTEAGLSKLFTQYNNCKNSASNNFNKSSNKKYFHLTLRPGLNNQSLSIFNNQTYVQYADFGNKQTFQIGIEAEFVLKFNKNKWAIIIEPNYQYFKGESVRTETILGSPVQLVTKVDYKAIQFPVGLRHYFFITESSKLFLNASFLFELSTGSKVELEYNKTLEPQTSPNFAIGGGYKYGNKLSMELRYSFTRSILSNYSFWTSQYKSVALILGYSLF